MLPQANVNNRDGMHDLANHAVINKTGKVPRHFRGRVKLRGKAKPEEPLDLAEVAAIPVAAANAAPGAGERQAPEAPAQPAADAGPAPAGPDVGPNAVVPASPRAARRQKAAGPPPAKRAVKVAAAAAKRSVPAARPVAQAPPPAANAQQPNQVALIPQGAAAPPIANDNALVPQGPPPPASAGAGQGPPPPPAAGGGGPPDAPPPQAEVPAHVKAAAKKRAIEEAAPDLPEGEPGQIGIHHAPIESAIYKAIHEMVMAERVWDWSTLIMVVFFMTITVICSIFVIWRSTHILFGAETGRDVAIASMPTSALTLIWLLVPYFRNRGNLAEALLMPLKAPCNLDSLRAIALEAYNYDVSTYGVTKDNARRRRLHKLHSIMKLIPDTAVKPCDLAAVGAHQFPIVHSGNILKCKAIMDLRHSDVLRGMGVAVDPAVCEMLHGPGAFNSFLLQTDRTSEKLDHRPAPFRQQTLLGPSDEREYAYTRRWHEPAKHGKPWAFHDRTMCLTFKIEHTAVLNCLRSSVAHDLQSCLSACDRISRLISSDRETNRSVDVYDSLGVPTYSMMLVAQSVATRTSDGSFLN